jgi:predicted nucleic acid-binding protein
VIFLDTGFIFALIAESDVNHARAVEFLESQGERRLSDFVVTTNHVVAETLTLVRTRAHKSAAIRHELAVKIGENLFAGTFGRIYQVTAEDEREAFAHFATHRDQEYSFVDCVSFTVMLKLGITEALAFDAHFSHRFIVRPGPLQNR